MASQKCFFFIWHRTFNCWLLRRIFSFLRCFKAIFSESTCKTVIKQTALKKYSKLNYDEFCCQPLFCMRNVYLSEFITSAAHENPKQNTKLYRETQEVALFSVQTVLKSTKNSIRSFTCSIINVDLPFISSHWPIRSWALLFNASYLHNNEVTSDCGNKGGWFRRRKSHMWITGDVSCERRRISAVASLRRKITSANPSQETISVT